MNIALGADVFDTVSNDTMTTFFRFPLWILQWGERFFTANENAVIFFSFPFDFTGDMQSIYMLVCFFLMRMHFTARKKEEKPPLHLTYAAKTKRPRLHLSQHRWGFVLLNHSHCVQPTSNSLEKTNMGTKWREYPPRKYIKQCLTNSVKETVLEHEILDIKPLAIYSFHAIKMPWNTACLSSFGFEVPHTHCQPIQSQILRNEDHLPFEISLETCPLGPACSR